MTEKKLNHEQIARKGGMKILKKYGKEFYSKMGKKGARAKLKKYGTEYFKKMSLLGVAARKAKRDALKPLLEKVVDAILPDSSK